MTQAARTKGTATGDKSARTGPERVVIVGSDGMLGRAWCEMLARRGIAMHPLQHPRFDITDAEQVAALDLSEVDTVVNCAGFTDVDGAEQQVEQAMAVNGRGVGSLAERARNCGCRLVHYSTDYVFDGKSSRPYRVDDPTAPLGVYGRSKLEGEKHVVASGVDHLVVRTSWLYAPWGKNFVRTMARLGRERDRLRVVDDQRGRPTSAEHLAATTLALLEHGRNGIVHVTDGGECTWFELAREVVGRVCPQTVVEPCTTAEFPRPAPRPAYSVLDLASVEAVLGPMPAWQANVADVVARLE